MTEMDVYQASLFPETEASTSEQNEVTLFALASIKGVGFATVKALVDAFAGEVAKVWWEDAEKLSAILYDVRTPNAGFVVEQIKAGGKLLVSEARKTRAKYAERGIRLFLRTSPGFPQRLLDIPNTPSWLFVQGNAELLSHPAIVAIVGTRNPTEHGVMTGRRAASVLAKAGAVILSGLAEGIDATGHEVSVLFGAPTVAILGHGIDEVFPKSTASLRDQIVRHGGALVSEYLPWDSYSRDKFVMRNRIQAALSHAVCIVEAQAKPGTAHTYRFSRQMERALFGVRVGDWRHLPQEELLRVMEQENRPVFDLEHEQGAIDMVEFLGSALEFARQPSQTDAPRLFRSLVYEVENIARSFDATDEDMLYLIKQIKRIHTKLKREQEADHS